MAKPQLITRNKVTRPSQDQIRKVLEQAGLSTSQADDAAIYASRRVRNEVTRDDPKYSAMRQIVLAVTEHLRCQGVAVPEFPDYKLESVIATLIDEWDYLIPDARRVGGAA